MLFATVQNAFSSFPLSPLLEPSAFFCLPTMSNHHTRSLSGSSASGSSTFAVLGRAGRNLALAFQGGTSTADNAERKKFLLKCAIGTSIPTRGSACERQVGQGTHLNPPDHFFSILHRQETELVGGRQDAATEAVTAKCHQELIHMYQASASLDHCIGTGCFLLMNHYCVSISLPHSAMSVKRH